MLDATAKKLLRLLHSDQPPERRRAAALVLGEVGVRDPEAGRALSEALDDPDPALRLQALEAVGKLRVEQALPQLLARVTEGGPESEAAAHAAARLGPKGVRGLRELMNKVAPGLRRRIAGALAAAGAGAAGAVALDGLLDTDPGVVDAAARSLSGQVPALSEAQRKSLADQLLELLGKSKQEKISQISEAAVVRLLAALHDPRAEAILWDRIEPGHAAEVRTTALKALGGTATAPTRDRLRRLLACAAEPDFNVAAPALMLLKAVPVADRALADWLELFDAPDMAVRRLALEKIGDRDRPEVAQALLRQLEHRDRGLRDAALARLARLDQGRQALAEALLAAETAENAWLLARAQAPFVREYPTALREQVFAEVCRYLEAGDRRADALVFLLREADARELRDRLEEQALALRKKKQYGRALIYLRLLGRDPSAGAPIRLELAACGLKESGKDLAAEARAADPCLDQFAHLLSSHPEELRGFLAKAKWLEPEDLFYLGFHFAEKDRAGRQLAAEVLPMVIKRSPRSQLGKDAKSKLRREGLE